MIDIKLVNIEEDQAPSAVRLAYEFNRKYPNRLGIRKGCEYVSNDGSNPLYVYRTKTQMVVRGRT